MTGFKTTFPPVSVASEEQLDRVVTLVNYYSRKFTHKLMKSTKVKGRPRKPTNSHVLEAEQYLPVDVVDHIKSCFSKGKMELYKPGRRTHNGVKKHEKVASFEPSLTLLDSENFDNVSDESNSSCHSAGSVTVIDNFEFLSTTPREYYFRTREERQPPKKYPLQVKVPEELEETGMELSCQEPERVIDFGQALTKSLVLREYKENLEEAISEEGEFKEVLEWEVFGDKIPTAVYRKAPRKGLSERQSGRGGRNELWNRKLRDSQVQSGVDYLLDPASHPQPNFQDMFFPSVKRPRIKMEDLEDELDDEEFKMPMKKARRENIRRSGRLQQAQMKKESGEYFVENMEVNIEVSSDWNNRVNDDVDSDDNEEDSESDTNYNLNENEQDFEKNSSDEDIDEYLKKSLDKFSKGRLPKQHVIFGDTVTIAFDPHPP